MKKLVSLLLTAAIFFSALPMAFAAPREDIAITEIPDYKGFILSEYDYLLTTTRSHRWKCNTAIRFHLATGEQKYLDDAVKFFTEDCNNMAANPNWLSSYGSNFFTGNYIMQTYWELKKLGLVTAEQTKIISDYMKKFFQETIVDSHNQVIARAVGVAYAIHALPDHPDWQRWRNWLDKIWNYWYEDRDMQEDAGDYNAVMMRDIIYWAQLDGKTDLLKNDPEIRKMFERYRDQVAPNGSMPEYGDDFYGRTLDWIFIFEYCANLYDDPTFAYAARHMFDWGLKNGLNYPDYLIDTEILSIPEFYDTAYLNDEASTIATHNYKNDKNVSEKVFLRSTKQDGTPFIMLDNARFRVSHSHPAAKGAVVYYEYDNIPLYHSLTRRFVDPRYQNIPLIMEDIGYYPFDTAPGQRQNPGRGRTGVWYHDSLDLRDLPASDDNNPTKREFDVMCFRLSKEKSPEIWYYADNIRLEGPAGVKMIYDFEDGSVGKFARKDNPFEVVNDGYNSNKALKITVDDTDVFYNANEKFVFDTNEYTHIKWDWKTATPSGDATTDLWSCYRLTDNDIDESKVTRATLGGHGECYIQIMPGEMFNNDSYMTNEMVENKGGDSYTSFKLNHHITPNSTVERRIVLTEEGYAVIQDTVTPGEEADGFLGGPIFNLYNTKESGRNWFLQKGEKKWYRNSKDTEGGTNGMLVYYAERGDAEAGHIKTTTGADTTYLKTTFKKNTPITFITVLAPNIDDVKKGKEIAGNIVVTKDNLRDSVVNIKTDKGWITVNMPDDNSWSVVRNQKIFAGIKIKLNDSYMSFNQPPVNVNGRILVPLRSIFEALGATVSYNAEERTATGEREGRTVKVKIDDTTAYVDGVQKTLDVPAQIINSRTMVPIRFISESFDSSVVWNNDLQLVEIYAQIPESLQKDDKPTSSQPILSNGDMEYQSAGWALQKSSGGFDKEVKRNGTTSMKLTTDPANETTWRGFRHDDIEVEAGCTYKISAWFKTENLKSGSKPRITFGVKNGAGEWIVRDNDETTKNLLIHTNGNVSDWTEMSATYTIPEGGSAIGYFTPRLDNTKDTIADNQTVWFDDITIELVEN